MSINPRTLLAALLVAAAAALITEKDLAERLDKKDTGLKDHADTLGRGHRKDQKKDHYSSNVHDQDGIHYKVGGHHKGGHHQTPEDLGFDADGVDASGYRQNEFSETNCLDLGARGFPVPVFSLIQENQWDPLSYFEALTEKGYAEDALQMTGPQSAILGGECMKDYFKGRVKHIFVGDSQMMALRNAYHRLSRCPEIWWSNATEEDKATAIKDMQRKKTAMGRLHSSTRQTPDKALPRECKESGVASFISWDARADPEIPMKAIQKEIDQLGLQPTEVDTVVVWVGSNFIPTGRRMSVLLDSIDKLQALGVKMIWDSPTFQDAAIMTVTSDKDLGTDPHSKIPIRYTAISERKVSGQLGSGGYKVEKKLLDGGIEIPMTKRWQLTNRYRGLQCDGIHTDMRARDPLFYDTPCPAGAQKYGESTYCDWVEPFQHFVKASCPQASGVDDLVLQSGLYAVCAAHETPFCYVHTESIR